MTKEQVLSKYGVPEPKLCKESDFKGETVHKWYYDPSSINYVLIKGNENSGGLIFYANAPQLHEIHLPEEIGIFKVGNDFVVYSIGDAERQYCLNVELPNENVFASEIEARLAAYNYFNP